jgi:hypothetical protein
MSHYMGRQLKLDLVVKEIGGMSSKKPRPWECDKGRNSRHQWDFNVGKFPAMWYSMRALT